MGWLRCWSTVLWVVGCGGAAPSAEAPSDEAKQDAPERLTTEQLQAQFARESDAIQKHPVRGEKLWSAYMESETAPVVKRHEEFYEVVAELGWGAELTCFVYFSTIDAGAASHTMIKAARQAVEFRELKPYHLANAGLDPIVGIRGIYNTQQNGITAVGDYKLMVMPRLEYPVLCTHDAPGYAESFARVTSDFAASFEFESKKPEPMRGELWRVLLEDVPVGFSQRYTYEMQNRQVRTLSISARFVPTAPGEIAFEDTVDIVNWDRKGSLLDGRFLSFENGESNIEMTLEKSKKGYSYAGTVQSKQLQGNFRSRRPIVGQFSFERKLKQLADKKQKSKFDQWEYLPSLDPSGSSKVTYEVVPEQGMLFIQASMGKRSFVMQANGRGVVKHRLFAVGPRKIKVDLVEEVGEL